MQCGTSFLTPKQTDGHDRDQTSVALFCGRVAAGELEDKDVSYRDQIEHQGLTEGSSGAVPQLQR